MPYGVTQLEDELVRTLNAVRSFRESRGVINFPAMQMLFEGKSENRYLRVAVVDDNGYFFRGRIYDIDPAAETFDMLADDDEMVHGMTVGSIRAVQLQDKK